jgi:hypothetical protein
MLLLLHGMGQVPCCSVTLLLLVQLMACNAIR